MLARAGAMLRARFTRCTLLEDPVMRPLLAIPGSAPHAAAVLTAIVLTLACPAGAAGTCPENSIIVSRTDVISYSTTPTASIEFTTRGDEIVPWQAGLPCTEACYDLPKATIVVRGFNTLYGPGSTGVDIRDDYVVVGPAGPPLSFEVVLQLRATIDMEGTVHAGLTVPGSPSPSVRMTETGGMELASALVVEPGVPFRIGAFATAVGGRLGGTGLAEVTIRFRGLPASYVMNSCQGFDRETPARPVSWGSVKAHYR